MNYEHEKSQYISFCGSYCHQCDWFTGKIRKTAKTALDMIREYGFKRLFEGKIDNDNLIKGLEILSESGICSGCKSEIAKTPEEDWCRIRQCCFKRGFELCNECSEFPCEILKNNPGVIKFHCIENLMEIKAIGIENWIKKRWTDFVVKNKD